MNKICIFCGERPVDKNKEHVIPKWLIDLTGNLSRPINLGIFEGKLKNIAFNQFTFPACEKCNADFGCLENKVKPIVIKILNNDFLEAQEISLLLDWFDKVRIGLWLGYLYLQGTKDIINPHIFINSRCGSDDRFLSICKLKSIENGINFLGVQTPMFAHIPSAFSLRINNLYFTNISFQGLLSERLGFPYIKGIQSVNEKQIGGELLEGTAQIKHPVIRRPIKEKGTFIYQPMFKNFLNSVSSDDKIFNTEYYKKFCLDYTQGIGGIFVGKSGENEKFLPNNIKIKLISNNPEEYDFFDLIGLEIFRWQNWLSEQINLSLSSYSASERRDIKKSIRVCRNFNNNIVDKIIEKHKQMNKIKALLQR